MPKDYDDMQQDLTEVTKAFLRKELSKGYYHGNIQAVVVTTNKVTGKVNVDSCNVPLMADVKKMLSEAYEQLQRSQYAGAIASMLLPKKAKKRGKKK